MPLIRRHIADTTVKPLGVVPAEIAPEVLDGLLLAGKTGRIAGITLYQREGRLDKWIVVGSPGAAEYLTDAKVKEHLHEALRLHLNPSVVVQPQQLNLLSLEPLAYQRLFDQLHTFTMFELPTHSPGNHFTRIFIENQIQIKKQPFGWEPQRYLAGWQA